MNNILYLKYFIFIILCSSQSIAKLIESDAILGIRLNAQQDGLIKIYKNANRVDLNTPAPKLRDQQLKKVW